MSVKVMSAAYAVLTCSPPTGNPTPIPPPTPLDRCQPPEVPKPPIPKPIVGPGLTTVKSGAMVTAHMAFACAAGGSEDFLCGLFALCRDEVGVGCHDRPDSGHQHPGGNLVLADALDGRSIGVAHDQHGHPRRDRPAKSGSAHCAWIAVEAHPPTSSPHSPNNAMAATHARLSSQFAYDMMTISLNLGAIIFSRG